ncbi:hypothetical protein ACLIAG_000114 [Enterobacter hormaechei]|uniref:Uncharacterized protein n=1 Tax=Enterobacter hormaechei TaxID=158836 RepID=A0A6G4LLG5_9ENTR|nr:hypothetical protein [Enterobacter hormaechei]MCU3241930.1 hypothetical protein [Enterobacter hormaechei subsp. steigerwaltii]GJA00450.1 hypothetical protein ECV0102_07980 [Enterobacter cloacae]ELD3407731.1 hypothetical protein [Enterobacter hormaechei]MBJ6443305.1 hypothetical protein [Enterobacter hormaechei]MBT1528972.1 hypothetical protein [Enterobacter hormaechei subsp. xiangfangensis]
MIPVIVVIAALSGLVALNRSGRIGNEFFAAAVALILFGVAGYLGVSQY